MTEADSIITQQLKIEINGHERFVFQDKEYFQIRQPMMYHTSVPGYNIKESDRIEMIQPIVIAYRDAGTATGTAITTLHNTVSSYSGTTFKTTFNLLIGTNYIGSITPRNLPKIGDILEIQIKDKSEIVTAARYRKIHVQVSSVAAQTNGWNIGVVVTDESNSVGTQFIVATSADDLIFINIIGRLQNPRSRCSQLE